MPDTFTLIASSTVGAGGTASIDFTSIPSTYTDLVLKFSSRDTNGSTNQNINLTFNGVGGTSYSSKLLFGTGSAAQSFSASSAAFVNALYSAAAAATSNIFSNGEIYIPNYTSSNNKSFSVDSVTENNATSSATALTAGLFSNTNAITSITLTSPSGTLVQYSSAYLYGIKNS